jgi:transcriptional regulator with XRE-family HTH domain
MTNRTTWTELKARTLRTKQGQAAFDDEARVAAFRALVHRVRTDAGLTQAEIAERMGTTQSAIARMEGGGVRPTLETLEKLARAIGSDLVVGLAPDIADKRINSLVASGRAVIREAS